MTLSSARVSGVTLNLQSHHPIPPIERIYRRLRRRGSEELNFCALRTGGEGGISAAISNESFTTNFQWLPNIGLGFSSVTAIFDPGIRLPRSIAAATIVPKRDGEPFKHPPTAPVTIARYNAFSPQK